MPHRGLHYRAPIFWWARHTYVFADPLLGLCAIIVWPRSVTQKSSSTAPRVYMLYIFRWSITYSKQQSPSVTWCANDGHVRSRGWTGLLLVLMSTCNTNPRLADDDARHNWFSFAYNYLIWLQHKIQNIYIFLNLNKKYVCREAAR